MRILYINNPFDNEDNKFLVEVKTKYDIEVIDFREVRGRVQFRATPTILLVHDNLKLKDSNISCVLDSPTIDELEDALAKEYPYPEPEQSQPTEFEILGQEVVNLKLSDMQKDLLINTLGQELTKIKLQLMQGGM